MGSQRVGHDWVTELNWTDCYLLGFSGGSDGKESACSAGDPGLAPGSGKYPGEENGNPLQYSCLENSHGWRSLACYTPWSHKELDMTERLIIREMNINGVITSHQSEWPSSKNNQCWGGFGEKRTFLHCWQKCKLVQPLWRTVWRYFLKTKIIELPYDPT